MKPDIRESKCEIKDGIKYITHYVTRPIQPGDPMGGATGTADKTTEIVMYEYNSPAPTPLSYVKEKIKIVEELMTEDTGIDNSHSQFLSGMYNAYSDVLYALEHGSLRDND